MIQKKLKSESFYPIVRLFFDGEVVRSGSFAWPFFRLCQRCELGWRLVFSLIGIL